jgi:hypothetical protein
VLGQPRVGMTIMALEGDSARLFVEKNQGRFMARQ